jgi:hypothetical protein
MVDEINNETDWLKIRMQQIPFCQATGCGLYKNY